MCKEINKEKWYNKEYIIMMKYNNEEEMKII